MPSNYTEHFGLSQWERADKVQMEDFNADNARIDAALACHPSGELIADVTVEEESTTLEIDLTQVDWSRYLALVLIADTVGYDGFSVDMGSGGRCSYMLSSSQSVFWYQSLAELHSASHMTMLIPVFYHGGHVVSTIAFATGSFSSNTVASFSVGGSLTLLEQCGKIVVKRDKPFQVGDHVALWGVK